MNETRFKPSPQLTTFQLLPENQETPVAFIGTGLTPTQYMYRRNHFAYPSLDRKNLLLHIDGHVEKGFSISLLDLINMESEKRTISAVLECAGNKRSKFTPKAFGNQFGDGAISHCLWTGIPLRCLLEKACIRPQACEVVFHAHDSYRRSLPLDRALHPDTLVAYQLNGNFIPFRHGFPLRLVVPSWYGMSWIKWLKKIELVTKPFQGRYQTEEYVIRSPLGMNLYPVTTILVNSTVQYPLDYSKVSGLRQTIRGIAWSGSGWIVSVRISFDKGCTWHSASLGNQISSYSWVPWKFTWRIPSIGNYRFLVSATDSGGNTQPVKTLYNPGGYSYNAMSVIHVKVEN